MSTVIRSGALNLPPGQTPSNPVEGDLRVTAGHLLEIYDGSSWNSTGAAYDHSAYYDGTDTPGTLEVITSISITDGHITASPTLSTVQSATGAQAGVVSTAAQNFAGNKTFDNDVIITGDLTVNGTTTTVNTSNLSVADSIITCASGNSGATAAFIGLHAERGGTDAFWVFGESSSRWYARFDTDETNIHLGTAVAIDVGDVYVNGHVICATDDVSCTVTTVGHTHSYLPLSGGTLTGFLTLHADPSSDMQAATKQYVDNNSGESNFVDLSDTYGTLINEHVMYVTGNQVQGSSNLTYDTATLSITNAVNSSLLSLVGDSVTTGNAVDLSVDGLTGGKGLSITSTSTNMSQGMLLHVTHSGTGLQNSMRVDHSGPNHAITIRSTYGIAGYFSNARNNSADTISIEAHATNTTGKAIAVKVGDGQLAHKDTYTATDGATITFDMNNGNIQAVTLGGNRTIAAPTNMEDGSRYTFIIKQDGTGNRTVTWNSAWLFSGGTAPTISTGKGSIDVFSGYYDGTNLYVKHVYSEDNELTGGGGMSQAQKYDTSGSHTWSVPSDLQGGGHSVHVMLVGAGASGSKYYAGGGGGQIMEFDYHIDSGTTSVTVSLGAGGASVSSGAGNDGGNSTFGSDWTASGGNAGYNNSGGHGGGASVERTGDGTGRTETGLEKWGKGGTYNNETTDSTEGKHGIGGIGGGGGSYDSGASPAAHAGDGGDCLGYSKGGEGYNQCGGGGGSYGSGGPGSGNTAARNGKWGGGGASGDATYNSGTGGDGYCLITWIA